MQRRRTSMAEITAQLTARPPLRYRPTRRACLSVAARSAVIAYGPTFEQVTAVIDNAGENFILPTRFVSFNEPGVGPKMHPAGSRLRRTVPARQVCARFPRGREHVTIRAEAKYVHRTVAQIDDPHVTHAFAGGIDRQLPRAIGASRAFERIRRASPGLPCNTDRRRRHPRGNAPPSIRPDRARRCLAPGQGGAPVR